MAHCLITTGFPGAIPLGMPPHCPTCESRPPPQLLPRLPPPTPRPLASTVTSSGRQEPAVDLSSSSSVFWSTLSTHLFSPCTDHKPRSRGLIVFPASTRFISRGAREAPTSTDIATRGYLSIGSSTVRCPGKVSTTKFTVSSPIHSFCYSTVLGTGAGPVALPLQHCRARPARGTRATWLNTAVQAGDPFPFLHY